MTATEQADHEQPSSEEEPFWKSTPFKVLVGLWAAKRLFAGAIRRNRRHRQRAALKELRATQRARSREARQRKARWEARSRRRRARKK